MLHQDLLQHFQVHLNADNVQRGRSVFADKMDQEVVSSSLSIYDDGTLEGGLQSAASDGEGISSQRTPLIEKGILKNFLYDIYTAKKGGVEPTGNGMRSSYGDVPAVGLSNLILDFDDVKEISAIDEWCTDYRRSWCPYSKSNIWRFFCGSNECF